MRALGKTGAERRADSFGSRRESHVDKEPRFLRFAGQLFNLKPRREPTYTGKPSGLNFGNRDSFGPDDSWATKEPITYKPVPDYYTSHETY
jgi:hypothetical protein